jgi:hypothetical protein
MGIHKVNFCTDSAVLEDLYIKGDEEVRSVIWDAIAEVRPDLSRVTEDRSTVEPDRLFAAFEPLS